MLLPLLLIAGPPVALGPEQLEQAAPLEAPIYEVTVFSDRARVRRRVTVDLAAVPKVLRFPELPGGVLLDTVRVDAGAAKVHRVEVAPVVVERFSIDQANGHLDRLETLLDESAGMAAEHAVWQATAGLLNQVQPALPPTEAEREGRPGPAMAPDLWKRALDFLSAERVRVKDRLRVLSKQKRDKDLEIERVRQEIGRLDLGGFSEQRVRVTTLVSGEGKSELVLEYFVPGASWVPRYEIRYLADKEQVKLFTGGLVTQASGESWDNVRLHLSTAIPNVRQDLPKLLTWTLGEAKEFVPVPRPKEALPRPPVYPMPRPVGRLTMAERDRALAEARTMQRLERLASVSVGYGSGSGAKSGARSYGFADEDISGDLVAPEGAFIESRAAEKKRRPAPPPAPSAPAPVARMQAAEVATSADSAPGSVLGGLFASRAEPMAMMGLALFEPPLEEAPPLDPSWPAALAGGLDYEYPVPMVVSIASDGASKNVPIAAETYPVQTVHESSPGIVDVAYLAATVVHKGDRPILGGPVVIYAGNVPVGDETLETTAPGGKIHLPLGADEDVKVFRKIMPETKTEGVFSKDDLTTYKVVIEVVNYKKRSTKVRLFEPLPKSNNKDIEIKLIKSTPATKSGPDAEGLLTWELELGAGKKQVVELEYRLERPADWRLWQQ